MKSISHYLPVVLLGLLFANVATAETRYITTQLQFGLHEEKTLDSPIVDVLPAGTALEIIKTEADVSYVRAPNGSNGWIDNSYLVNTGPSDLQKSLQDKNGELEKQLAAARNQIKTLQTSTATGPEMDALEERLNTEKLRAGELEEQLSTLRKRIGQDNDNTALYNQIEQLEADKKNLEVQLSIAEDSGQTSGDTAASFNSGPGWRNLVIYLIITLILGIGAGIYLMDFFNRRRHGGFRV